MNSAYGPAGINFKLMNVSRTENARWAAGMDEFSMKSTLRKGSYSALNIYFAPNLSGGLLGFCYFPKADLYPYDKIVDGCVIFSSTVPGGDRARFNEGKTATHEVGHYMGLYHVFNEKNGDCSKDGDMVDDTPIQGTKTSGCPAGKDSCPAPGLDSIHNFMDYSDDSCMTEFTPGQNARMQMMWQKFRAGK
uniref:Metalloprotease 1 n=1 Tax=Onygena corvina TaxID=180788 RepID=A0A0B4VL16_9EURO|nr:metalloprotease 1 [Onygena corvina]